MVVETIADKRFRKLNGTAEVGIALKTMFSKNKFIIIGAAGVGVLWLMLYFVMVGPTWMERDRVREKAQEQLQLWQEFYKESKDPPTVKLGEGICLA